MAVKAKRVSLPVEDAPAGDEKAERLARCEVQCAVDRQESQRVLRLIGKGIEAWQSRGLEWEGFPPDAPAAEWKGLFKLAYLFAQALWLEKRITQTEMMATPLYCPGCGESGGSGEMKFECLAHAEQMNMATALNLGRSWFCGVPAAVQP